MMGCEQHMNDQAEFNRLLIEENRRLRSQERTLKDQVLIACEQRDKAENRIDQLKGQLQSAEAQAWTDREQYQNNAKDLSERLDKKLNEVKTERNIARQEAQKLQTQMSFWAGEAYRLAEKAGWVAYGTHSDGRLHGPIEFDGQDGAGEPLWERPVQEQPNSLIWKRTFGGTEQFYRYHNGVLQWRRNSDLDWVNSTHESIEEISALKGNTVTAVTS